ncbi:MAG: acyl carrier protein [Pseudomonadota bacterium]
MAEPNVEQVSSTIHDFVKERFPLAGNVELDNDTSLLESGIVDSLGVLNLVEFVEEQFSIVAEDDDLVPENFDTIDALTRFVLDRV